MYIEMILWVLGLSEKDMLEDPLYLKELQIRPYPIDTLVNLLMRKKLLLVLNWVDDYNILRNFWENDTRSQLDALIEYYVLIYNRYKTSTSIWEQVTKILN